MSSFLLPRYQYLVKASDIVPSACSDHNNWVCVSESLKKFLDDTKEHIEIDVSLWDTFKRYTNPYEYVHTVIPGSKTSVCKLQTVSRAFFKFNEILIDFNLLDGLENRPLLSFHLAEGPGGFMEATARARSKHENPNDAIIGMTLIDEKNSSVPGWGKLDNFVKSNNAIKLEFGSTGTGDLLDPDNLRFCFEKYRSKVDIVTGDGGFDFSGDYNNQEGQSLSLSLAQVFFAIAIQRKGGHFVLKIFDMFSQLSVEIALLLSSLYSEVYVSKPLTSRQANSERYLVCKGFRIADTSQYALKFYSILSQMRTLKSTPHSIIDVKIARLFKDRIYDINATLGQQQIENIKLTLELMRTRDTAQLETLRKNGIHRCVSYCQKYDLLHSRATYGQNIFLPKTSPTI